MEAKLQQQTPQKVQANKPNLTGIPTQMKLDFEQRSGLSFDDVRVHYNSDKPAQLQALAYTQGTQVYVGPGQERHLKHELGHVVQQMTGLVFPTKVINGVTINDSPLLEKMADTMSLHPAIVCATPQQKTNIVQCASGKVAISLVPTSQENTPFNSTALTVDSLTLSERFDTGLYGSNQGDHVVADVLVKKEQKAYTKGKTVNQVLDYYNEKLSMNKRIIRAVWKYIGEYISELVDPYKKIYNKFDRMKSDSGFLPEELSPKSIFSDTEYSSLKSIENFLSADIIPVGIEKIATTSPYVPSTEKRTTSASKPPRAKQRTMIKKDELSKLNKGITVIRKKQKEFDEGIIPDGVKEMHLDFWGFPASTLKRFKFAEHLSASTQDMLHKHRVSSVRMSEWNIFLKEIIFAYNCAYAHLPFSTQGYEGTGGNSENAAMKYLREVTRDDGIVSSSNTMLEALFDEGSEKKIIMPECPVKKEDLYHLLNYILPHLTEGSALKARLYKIFLDYHSTSDPSIKISYALYQYIIAVYNVLVSKSNIKKYRREARKTYHILEPSAGELNNSFFK